MRGSAILLVAASLALGACGADDEQTSSSTSTVDKAVPDQVEKAEKVPDLPNGWTVISDPVQGFRLGAPPGWKDGRDCLLKDASPGEVAVLCSPDKLVTLSITVDRSADGLTLNPADFAQQTLDQLATEGFRGPLDAGKPKPFDAHYRGASVTANGTTSSGVRENVTVVAQRRDAVANFTAVIAANADKPTEPAVKLAEDALRTPAVTAARRLVAVRALRVDLVDRQQRAERRSRRPPRWPRPPPARRSTTQSVAAISSPCSAMRSIAVTVEPPVVTVSSTTRHPRSLLDGALDPALHAVLLAGAADEEADQARHRRAPRSRRRRAGSRPSSGRRPPPPPASVARGGDQLAGRPEGRAGAAGPGGRRRSTQPPPPRRA